MHKQFIKHIRFYIQIKCKIELTIEICYTNTVFPRICIYITHIGDIYVYVYLYIYIYFMAWALVLITV